MVRFAILRALSALLATVQTVLSTPLSTKYLSRADTSSYNDAVWPSTLNGQIYGTSWPEFANKTERWSSYKAPTFDEVFLPENENDLSLGHIARVHVEQEHVVAGQIGRTWIFSNSAVNSGWRFSQPRKLQSCQSPVWWHSVVGTGAYFSDLINAVGAAGRELTVGSCPCVGSTGAMLGGGLGRLQGLHGLTSDALRKVRLALWNGTIIEASERQNQDLFWGIRGSGQNYGIVFESTYETWPATHGGVHYSADMTFAKSSIEKVMKVVNKLTSPALDDKLALITFFPLNVTTSELTMIVNVVHSGPKEVGQNYTKLFLPYSLSLEEHMLKWEELPTKTVFGLIPYSCASGPPYDLYSVNARTLNPPPWVDFGDQFEKFMQQHPAANGSSMMIETFPVQGIEALRDDYSAFPHRRYFHNIIEVIGVYTDYSIAKPVDDFLRSWRDKFAATSGYEKLHLYQNYAHDDEPLSALYGYQPWRHERLTKLKGAYDPYWLL